MALDDRDLNFEKALARQVRSNAADAFDCPDAETLAAYHERMLSPQEMAAQKSHIAACSRCQEILANLEITETIPIETEENHGVVAQGTVRAFTAVHTAPAVSEPARLTPTAEKSSSVARMPKRRPYLRWAAPAGAIAAGLLVLLAVNSGWNAQKHAKQAAAVEVAENREQKNAELAAPKSEPQPSAPMLKGKAPLDLGDEVRLKQEPDATGSAGRSDAYVQPRVITPKPLEHGPRMMQNQVQNQIQNGTTDSYLNQKTRANDDQSSASAAVQIPLPSVNSPARVEQPKKIAAANEAAGAPPPPAETDKDLKGDVASAASTVEVVSGGAVVEKEKKTNDTSRNYAIAGNLSRSAGGAAKASMRDAKTLDSSFIHTPDPQVFWLISEGRGVLKTIDGGRTLLAQEIGAGIRALSGSAPSKDVCWLMTQNGIVLRTADGGKHWVQAATPKGVNFASVRASDMLNAVISDAPGKIQFVTADGGVTWKAAP